ncbi:MAG: CRISPR-associated endonuclease Cas2 [Bacilli bacterium]|nr:CRISPR-associated endonuclease Cas2 [Bacilli bacterium]
MRLILFFDLPTFTKQDIKRYSNFRKLLIQNGYMMIQYSVYSKIFNNRDAAQKHISFIQDKAPKHGHIRIMMVTEKQYSKMKIIIGGRTNQENIITIDPMLIL